MFRIEKLYRWVQKKKGETKLVLLFFFFFGGWEGASCTFESINKVNQQ